MARSAEVKIKIEKEGPKIRVTFPDQEGAGTITFNEDSGASGPGAFEKLRKVLNEVAPKD